ncbi:ankyrin-1-like [Limulus polyphemus]|uniref:Ankyrin-1-like n=1 Tax=Limulus polyphemus TaxID=6850 RepID=A0ABM1C3R7_LIMPO|nr:ankyrin-1-like [Limulus polyphemus]
MAVGTLIMCPRFTSKPTAADLHLAVAQRNTAGVESIVASGVNINSSIRGTTPLGLAIYRRYDDVVEILVQAGADVNQRSQDHLERIEPPLCSACRLGNLAVVKILLQTPSIDVNKRDFFNKTPLWTAVKEKRPDLVKLLLANKADVNAGEIWSECPLHLATKYRGRREIADMLIRSGCRVNVADSDDRTPLFWTIQHSDRRIFTLLIYGGAKIKNPDWLSQSSLPLSWKNDRTFCEWVEKLRVTPPRLSWLSRNCIRRWLALRWKQLDNSTIDLLPLPKRLKDFVRLLDVKET